MPDPARPSDPVDPLEALAPERQAGDVIADLRAIARRLAERVDVLEAAAHRVTGELEVLRSWLEVEHPRFVDGRVLVDPSEWERIARLVDFVLAGLPDPDPDRDALRHVA